MEELLKHLGEDVTISVADDAKGAHGKLIAVDDVGIFVLAATGPGWETPKFYPWDNIISVSLLQATSNP
jgi:hypothetical protein